MNLNLNNLRDSRGVRRSMLSRLLKNRPKRIGPRFIFAVKSSPLWLQHSSLAPEVGVQMARGKGKKAAVQSTLRIAGILPTLKKPSEAVGRKAHVPGSYWEKCAAADKDKKYVCIVREFDALHRFTGGRAPGAAFELQEMGEDGQGSLEQGVASGEVFWMSYPEPRAGVLPA